MYSIPGYVSSFGAYWTQAFTTGADIRCAHYSQGGVKFPTGGDPYFEKARERLQFMQGQQIWCNSRADG